MEMMARYILRDWEGESIPNIGRIVAIDIEELWQWRHTPDEIYYEVLRWVGPQTPFEGGRYRDMVVRPVSFDLATEVQDLFPQGLFIFSGPAPEKIQEPKSSIIFRRHRREAVGRKWQYPDGRVAREYFAPGGGRIAP